MKRMQGFNVLHPMGWDAFGLPAEQYALDTGNDPRDFTAKNIETFKRQLKDLGFSYDWDREINTTDPKYYKWTQWIFTKLYEQGLAFVDEVAVNWCPALGTVLANEEVIDGLSERGNHPVVRVPMRQWVLKITEYADRLLEDLDDLDWPDSVKEMQRNWIGKSEGAEIDFTIDGHKKAITVFTTRPDTIFGATYLVLAPEHPFVKEIMTPDHAEAVESYIAKVQTKSDLERTDLAKEKTGVFTGAFAVNPISGERLPIWIADYVLASYGTGAIMAVPGHDERDHEFAKQFELPIIEVVKGGNVEEAAYTGEGEHVNSQMLDGLGKQEAIETIIAELETNNAGRRTVPSRLRDWRLSRQRYWGEPIPVVHMEDGTMKTLAVEELPLELPVIDEIKPSGTGESPLALAEDWLEYTDPVTGMKGRRETNTMPQWGGSCWYYLRFIDPHNEEMIADPEKLKYWLPVDIYIGGAEHAVLHLLYARFWHKVLYDIGVVPTKEPFQKLYNQGMILGENNEKMSKSRGNVINPDEIVKSHGADTLRLYEMFMGPLDASVAWSENGLDGARRFLERVWRLFERTADIEDVETVDAEFERVYHQTVKKVTENYTKLHFNTGISQLMVFVNEANKQLVLPKAFMKGFVQLLTPVAPHLGEELWEQLGCTENLTYAAWPVFDEAKLVSDTIEFVIQVNGKVRSRMEIGVDASKEEIEAMAFADEKTKEWIDGKTVRKVIVVPKKLINIVAN